MLKEPDEVTKVTDFSRLVFATSVICSLLNSLKALALNSDTEMDGLPHGIRKLQFITYLFNELLVTMRTK